MLELMLGQIANYCPIISRNTIVKNSTSLTAIWQVSRLHYGFQSTGAHFIDFTDLRLEPDDRPEDLFQRLVAFVDDNLLRSDGNISHHDQNIVEDEEMTPTLENFVVLTWLRLIHVDLPRLVKQRYGTELRTRTLASIKPEISQALSSLLDEIRSEDARVMRTATIRPQIRPSVPRYSPGPHAYPQGSTSNRVCPLCKQVGRSNFRHFLSECTHLPEEDRRYMAKARQVINLLDDEDEQHSAEPEVFNTEGVGSEHPMVKKIEVRLSPYLDVFCRHHTTRVPIDSGATENMIRHSTAHKLGCVIEKSSQSAHQGLVRR